MENNYLQSIEDQERELALEQELLAQNIGEQEIRIGLEQECLEDERYFYQNCSRFSQFDIDQTSQILNKVAKLISVFEGEEYVLHKFSFTEEGHYVTESSSTLGDLIGVIDYHEVMESREFYQKWINPQTYSSQRIVPKSICDSFLQISFTNIYNYTHCLNQSLKDQKSFTFIGAFKPEDFAEEFPYVKEYLESLVAWRLENHTLEIPEEVMDELLNVPEQPEEMKLNKKLISQ